MKTQELNLITKRLEELEKLRTDISTKFQFNKEHVEEYNALLRMKEIIDNGFIENKKNEYLEEREKVGFPQISNEEFLEIKSGKPLKPEERTEIAKTANEILRTKESLLVENRISEITKISKETTRGKFILGSDMQSISSDYLVEYNALLNMRMILNNGFKE